MRAEPRGPAHHPDPDDGANPRRLIYLAAFIRAFGASLASVLVALYLKELGYGTMAIGLVLTFSSTGSALVVLLVGLFGDWLGRRRSLSAMAALTALGGIALALWPRLGVVSLVSLAGGIATSARGLASFEALEQAILPQTGRDSQRTRHFAHYNFLLTLGGALGALAAGLPNLLERGVGLGMLAGYRAAFLLYGGLGAVLIGVYGLLGEAIEAPGRAPGRMFLPPVSSKGVIYGLAALFALDSFAGGVAVQSFLSYWFNLRFGLTAATLGAAFFAANILSSLSFFIAVRLARRFGLLRVVVFSHIPASVLFMAMALAPTGKLALALFLARQLLSQMDIPTRQSYLMGLVKPEERVIAASTTMLGRAVAQAPAPWLGAYLAEQVSLASPIFLGGTLKIAYDLALFFSFRWARPPEERS